MIFASTVIDNTTIVTVSVAKLHLANAAYTRNAYCIFAIYAARQDA